MKNEALRELLDQYADAELTDLSINRFCLRCAQSVSQNLESEQAIECLKEFETWIEAGCPSNDDLLALRERIGVIARSHPGSSSIDGTRHAAVSATHTLAAAINSQALDAAAYAAYSTVYGYGGYALSDPSSFQDIHRQQCQWLKSLLRN